METIAREWFRADGLDHLEADPWAKTMEIDGVPVCSGGLADQGGGLAFAWAALTEIPAAYVTRAHLIYRKPLRSNNFRRVETFVEATFHTSLRWCRLLGFDLDYERPTVSAQGMTFVRMIYRGTSR